MGKLMRMEEREAKGVPVRCQRSWETQRPLGTLEMPWPCLGQFETHSLQGESYCVRQQAEEGQSPIRWREKASWAGFRKRARGRVRPCNGWELGLKSPCLRWEPRRGAEAGQEWGDHDHSRQGPE